jgi:hypothetical protein
MMKINTFFNITIISIYLFITCSKLFALEFKPKLSAVVLARNIQVYRGALINQNPLFFPAIGLELFDCIRFAGPRLEYFKDRDRYRFNMGVNYFDNDPPGFSKLPSDSELFRFKRGQAFEVYSNLSYSFEDRSRLYVELSKELHHHFGEYLYAEYTHPVLPLTSIGMGLGSGDANSAHFIYGEGAKGGLLHQDFILQLFIPFLFADGRMFLRLSRPHILHARNRNASYILPTDRPYVVNILAIWPL